MEGRRGFFIKGNDIHEYEIVNPTFIDTINPEIVKLWLNGNEALGLEFVCMYDDSFVFRHSNTDVLEHAARHLLSVIDKAPYRLTAQTFGQDAVEVGTALKELRVALNETKSQGE